MRKMKKCWITEQTSESVSLSFESMDPSEEHTRLFVRELQFPSVPTPEHPRRHTLVLSLLGVEDLIEIRDTLDRYLADRCE